MNAVMDAIYAARLNELAGFCALPVEQLAHALRIVGGDPLKLEAAANLLMADGEAIPRPRSWPQSDHAVWAALPPPIQRIVADREFSRDRAVRLKQDEAAKAKQEVTRLQALIAPAPEAANSNGAQQKEENGKQ
jgi:hypothetical protein